MEKFTLERTFHAPIQAVWDAFVEEKKLREWWSPEGMTTSHISVDLNKEGKFTYCFGSPDGKEYWGRGIYKVIEAPTHLAYQDSFADAEGNPVPASHYGLPGDDIIETMVDIHFSSNGEKTHMKAVMDNPYGDAMTQDMTKGWNSMFDKLTKLLSEEK